VPRASSLSLARRAPARDRRAGLAELAIGLLGEDRDRVVRAAEGRERARDLDELDEFLDDLGTSLRETFVERERYLDLRAAREAA
jgi:hypothetical protein